MRKTPNWLPHLLTLESCQDNWDDYLNSIYSVFKTDFIDNQPKFKGLRVGVTRNQIIQGKETTFWHLISEGRAEEDRIPDLRRCERIRWVKAIIEHSDDSTVKVWKNRRKSDKRICLWLENQEYLVVLAERRQYVILWTAYLVILPHVINKLQKEYTGYINADAAP